MTEEEYNKNIDKVNQIMQRHGIYAMDDYFTEVYKTKEHKWLFSVKHQRFFESQQEADDILQKVLNYLVKFDKQQ
jgi:hypothetical protein